MSASGFAGLGLQIVWTQQSALWLGHETAAVLAVIAAFFGGLAVGALALGSRIDRSERPARWYAGCEAVIGLWSFALLFLMAPVSDGLLGFIGAQPAPLTQWTVVFCGTFALLLPATAAMGATLPAMERVIGTAGNDRTPIAMLYAANTFGAVLGVVAAAFVLVPRFGLILTAAFCLATNFFCAALSLKVFAKRVPATPAIPASVQSHLPILAITGLLGIGYEVLVVRVLSQVAENTVYTFAILLAMYLVGTTLGAAAYARWSGAMAPERMRDRLLQTLAAACLVGVALLAFAGEMKSVLLSLLGPGMAAALFAESVLAIAAFLLPTFVMGALFSHLAGSARASGVSFARTIGFNTLGAAFAPVLFGVALLPALGSTFALLAVAGGYLLLSTRAAWFKPAQWSAVAGVVAFVVWAPSLALIELPVGGRVISYTEGAAATVSVIENEDGVATLHINNRQQEGSSVTLLADARQGLLPILLHPSPRRALFLGVGTGVTSRSAAEDSSLEVDAVELLPEVVAASGFFTRAFGEQMNPRLRVLTADARRFVRTAPEFYDVIVADNFHPARSGSGSLYTVEHFAAVRERLTAGGLFCQWLPLHQLDLDTLRSIVGSYLEVYPRGTAILATNSLETPVLGLVARRNGERLDLDAVRARLAGAKFSRPLADFGLADDFALLGSFVASAGSLARFAAGAPLNTDDHPVVTYLAPRITYAPDSAPRDRLLEFLGQVESDSTELFETRDANHEARLAAYWQARDRFLEVGRNVQPTQDVQQMLAQVRDPLLSVLHISPDFRPAYDPLLRMAYGMATRDSGAARELLALLVREQPARPEAAEALRALGASP
ncbi:MAG TPA: fused MFS/spermidine synthase [Steroidobacteraceae bacterium]